MTTITSATSNAANANAQVTGLTADYTMFLKLLTTQMQHQDPLDPMDSSEYTQQLVQFSQVEQSIQQTTALKDVLAQLTGQQLSQASSFIGREARFDSNVSGLSDQNAVWTYTSPVTPASLKAVITDASGNVVREVELDPSAQGRFEWDGMTDAGTRAANGAYSLTLAATNASGEILPTTINSVAKVSDVVAGAGEIMLGVNGIRMPISGLIAVSEAK